ncbi:MAG: extracellular solute-binding protein [Caldilineaceae bacterium]|nr:extracellular solute-binding protein [Caldilineaceae bacterium]
MALLLMMGEKMRLFVAQRQRRVPYRVQLSLLGLLLILAGCGGNTEEEPLVREPVTLTLMAFNIGETWEQAEGYAIEQFQLQEPNISFEQRPFNQAPQQAMTSTPAPDLMTSGAYSFLHQAAQSGLVIDLSELWAETGLNEAFSPGFQQLSAYEGKQYYLPVAFAWTGIYYNRQLFADYGLQPPTTWDEFIQICDQLKAYGEIPLSLSGQDAWMSMLWFDYLDLRLNGADVHRALLQGQLPYSDARIQNVIETWQMLFANGYFVERPELVGSLDAIHNIVRGDNGLIGRQKSAMILTGPFWMSDVPDVFRAELDFFPFPTMNANVAPAEVVTTLGYMAPRSGTHPEATLAFLRFMGSLEGQTAMAQQLGAATLWAPARSDIDGELLSTAVKQGMALTAEAPNLFSPFVLSLPNAAWAPVELAWQRYMRNTDETVAFLDALEAMRQRGQAEGWWQQ